MTEPDRDADDGDAAPVWPFYVYKPALMGAPWEFELHPEGLFWRYSRYSGLVPYDRITRVHLAFRPVTTQTYRFVAEIRAPQAPKLPIASSTWRSMTDQGRQDTEYNAFVRELHHRIAAAGGTPRLTSGMHPVAFLTGVLIFVAGFGGLVAFTVRALMIGEPLAAALVAGFLALFTWQIGNLLRRNRPGTYRPDALPELAMP